MDNLTEKYNSYKTAVEKGKENLAVAKKELEINTNNYKELLDAAKEKYGISTLEELKEKKEALRIEIETELNNIESKLKAGGLL